MPASSASTISCILARSGTDEPGGPIASAASAAAASRPRTSLDAASLPPTPRAHLSNAASGMPRASSARISGTLDAAAASPAASASRGATRRRGPREKMIPQRSAAGANPERRRTDSDPSPHIHRSAARVHASFISSLSSRLGTISRRKKSLTSGERLAGSGASGSAARGGPPRGSASASASASGADAFAGSTAPNPAKASADSMPSSFAPPPVIPGGVGGAVSAEIFGLDRASAGASRATVTASDRSPSLRHTSAAASACSPASTKNVAANAYLCLDMSAYAFFSAASLCRSSAKFLDKNSASLVSLAALKRPARTLVLPRAAYSSAHGFSPPGSRVAANSARAAASTSRRSSPSSLTHSGTPSRLSSDHAQPADSEDRSEDRSASRVSHCSAHASVSPLGPRASG